MPRRWSTRYFKKDVLISSDLVSSIIEAARWAPPTGNGQPSIMRKFFTFRAELRCEFIIFSASNSPFLILLKVPIVDLKVWKISPARRGRQVAPSDTSGQEQIFGNNLLKFEKASGFSS